MEKLDIFNDDEFQSLNLEEKQSITNNYFDTEMADDDFNLLHADEQKQIKNNFINAQLDFDISDTASKVMDYIAPEPSYTQTDEVTEPSLHDAIAPNIDGTMPEPFKPTPKKEETTLLQDTKDILFGTGKDYENPDATEYELGKRVVNRVNELTANAIQGTYNLLGNIKSPMEYLGIQTDAMKESNERRADWFKNASDNLNNFIQEENKLDVKPTHTWEEAKKAFKQEGVFSIDAWQELGNYIGSEGIASLPDMAEMVAMMPLYYASRQQESAEKRAENDGRTEPTKADYLATAPTVMGSIMLDKFSLNGMTTEVVQRVGKEALDGSMKDVVKVIGSEMKKGTLKEGATEALQNPLEMFGEELNTKKGLSTLGEYADNSLAGFVAGAGMGAGMSGTTATGTQIFNAYDKTKQESLREAYIQDTYNKQLLGGGIKTTIDKDGLIKFSKALDVKIKTIQSEFENLVINNPDVEIPVEAVDSIEIQEVIVAGAKEQGLDVSSQDGLNAIDKGFKELEAEIGTTEDDLTPKASEESVVIEEPVKEEPEPEVEETTIDVARLKELQEKPDDELTTDERFEIEDLQEEAQQLEETSDTPTQNLQEDETFSRGEFVDAHLKGLSDEDLQYKYKNNTDEKTKQTFKQEIERRTAENTNDDISTQQPKEVMFKKLNAKKAVRGELVDLVFGLKGVIVKEGANNNYTIYEYATGSKLHSWSDWTSWKKEDSIKSANEKMQKWGEAKVNEMIQEAISNNTLVNPEIVYAKDKMTSIPDGTPKKGQIEFEILRPDGTVTSAFGYPVKLAEGYDGFVKQDDDKSGWAVTEKRSGLIIKGAKTKTKAIADSNKAILQSKEKMPKMIEHSELQMKKAKVKDEALEAYKELDDKAKFNLHRSYLNDNITDEIVKKQSDTKFDDLGDTTKGAIVEQYIKNDNSFENFKKETIIGKEVQEDEQTKRTDVDGDGVSQSATLQTKSTSGVDGEKINQSTTPVSSTANTTSDVNEESRRSDKKIHTSTTTDGTSERGSQRSDTGTLSDNGSERGSDGRELANSGRTSSELEDDRRGLEPKLDDNFEIENELGEGGAKTKFKNNISAIKIVHKIQGQNYKPNQKEKIILSKYVGWGGLPSAFIRPDETIAKGWEKEATELKELLNDEQYAEARRSTQDAHYTSKEIVNAIWAGVKHLGFKGGKVLEPSIGVGNFFGMMPSSYKANTKLYGVELDGLTSTIAQTLYPKANIQNKGFQEVELSNDFSLVIGNPPFGSQKLFDKKHKHLNDMSIHNYFFAKSMDALEDGGILAMVVSNGLLDAGNTKTREYLGKSANLVGAIRLPNNAFSKNANTEVTTDIIFLQKRYKDQESNIAEWLNVGEVNDTPLNEYFVNNKDMMLGSWGKFGTMYRGDSPALIAFDEELKSAGNLLPDAIKSMAKNIVTHESVVKENLTTVKFDGDVSKVRIGAMFVQDGSIFKREQDKDGEVQVQEVATKLNSKGEEVVYKDNELTKIKGMIDVVGIADELRVLQLDKTATPSQLKRSRASLNIAYDTFVKKYKYLNNSINARLFEEDIRSPFLLALEKNYDKGISSSIAKRTGQLAKKENAQKADIFTKRTQTPYERPTKADNSQDALTISLSEYGNINLMYMQDLTGKSEEELIADLDGFMYDDTDSGWVTKEEFLSGNVKKKLAEATNPKYIEALKTVIPKDIDAVDISVTLGSSWIPKSDMQDFIAEITGDDNPTVTLVSYNAKWNVTANTTSANASRWGTSRRGATEILKQTMNLVQMEVKDNHGSSANPQWVVNSDETTAVQEKQEQLKAEFKDWIWKSSDRRERLAKLYNDKFNTKTLREFNGSHINFVGKSDSIDLRQHQKNGVWRMLQGGTVLFDHTVGTGKTYTAIAGVMELRRTGKANKPLIVVPNHLTAQWGKEWMELYPSASILVPTKRDFSAKRRKTLMSRIATGDYDGIIIAHSQLTKIQNDIEFEKSFIEDEIDRIQSAIDMLKAEDGKSRSVKDAEKSKERLQEKIDKLNDIDRDDNLDFSQLGIDAVVVDEAHEFKNLTYTTGLQKVAGLGNPLGSKKAFDLFIKTQNLLEKTNGNNVVFLTGTPISNTLAEMFTIQRYLSYDKLQAENLDVFDAWVKQYAEIVSDWELSPSGKYKLNTRLSKFNNMPELITEYKQFADVVTREDIPALPIPKIKGGRAQNIVVDRSEAQADYIGVEDENGRYPKSSLVYRSENLPKGKPKKGDDNMLKIMGEARKVALDMRLINPHAQDNPDSKVNLTVKNAYDIYKKWNSKKGTQLIFCDLSTPKGAVANEKAKIEALIKKADAGDEKASEALDKMNPDDLDALNSSFSVYDDIKAKLIAKGIPENQIAFIHDAKTDLQKHELFAKVKGGAIRILLGSTSKMGAGMNVQDRLVALHHIDVPWRPSDLEQREGRIIRQGNIFYYQDPDGFEVEIFRYATKNTLDSMMWQTIEAKANFIEQLRAGNLLEREVEDVSGEAMNAAEMKAMSSGNPLILEDMKIKKDIKKLEALKKGHDRNQYDLEAKIKNAQSIIVQSDEILKAYSVDTKLAKKLPKEFKINIDKIEYDKREDAGSKLIKIVTKLKPQESKLVGEFGGFNVYMENHGKGLGNDTTGMVIISGKQDYEFTFNIEQQSYDGLTLKIANTVKKIPEQAQVYEINLGYTQEQLPQLQEQVAEFKSANKLEAMKLRQKEIMAQLRKKDDDKKDIVDEDLETTSDSYMKAPKKPNFELIGEPRDISRNTTEIHLADKTREIANINTKPIVAYLEELRSKHPESFNSVKDVFKHIIEVKNSATFILQGNNPSNALLIKSVNGITKKIGIEKNNDEINLLVHALISKKPNEIRRLIKRQLERSPTLSFHNEVDTANGNKLLSTASVLDSIPSKQQKKQEAENELYARSNGYDEFGANYIPTYGFSGLPARPKDGTITIGYREVTLPTLDNPMNADSVRVHLSDIVGNRLYEAKIKNKSALGKYQRKDSAIRVKNYSDMEVLAHEMAHYLDYFHNNKTKKADGSFFRKEIIKNKDEVKALSYTTDPKNVTSEGFAEFVRLWLTNYNSLEMVAPKMVKDFENKLAKDQDLNIKMYNLQKVMHQYYYQGEHAMLRSKRGGELNSATKKIQRSQAEISKNIRQKVIDKIHTIKRIEAEIKGDVGVDAIDSAYKSLQLVNGHSSIMYSTMNNGVPTVLENGDISYSGKSLNDIFAPATKVSVDRVRLLEDYLVAKRASELMGQGRENLITANEINAGLDLVNIYPEFESIFNEYQEFNDAMLDFYVDMKMITTEQRENFKEMNKNYVPFNRVTESVQYGEVPPAKIGQRLTGGTHSLGNIMENIIDGVESNIKEALISRGKSMFYEMLETSGMGGVYATKVSVEDKLVQSDINQQAKKVAIIMSQLGVTVSKDGMILSGDILSDTIIDVKEIEQNLLDNPSALEFWTHGHPPSSEGGSYIDSVIINDKKVYFETNDIGMVDALTSFKGSQYNIVVQGLMSIKNIMTWNITNNPLFYLTNFARDTVSAGVLSKNKFIPVMSSISGMYHFITNSKTFKEYMASGAGYGTRRTALGGDIQAMQMLNVNRGFEIVTKLISAMEYGADIFEYGTRVGEFALAQEAGKSNMQSAFEAREVSTDFAIKGSDTTISGFMSTVPFMKAGLLGIDKTARRLFSLNGEMKFANAVKFKNQLKKLQKHKIKIYVTGGIIAGLTLSLWFANRDDERYKKLTRDSKLMYWHFFIGKQHIKIPRPYDIGFAFASVPEIIADGIYTKHGEEAAKDFIWGTKTMFSIGDISGLFQPILEDMTNTNWTGSPIVPANMQNLDDLSDQYFSTTPLLYKNLGKAIGVSPIMTQHYVSGYLGLTTKMIEEATENILWNKKEWGARPFERNALEFLTYRFRGKEVEPRSKYSEKYYELMQKASAIKASYDKKRKSAYVDGGKDIKEYMSDKEKKAYLTINKMLKKYNKNLTQIKTSVEVVSYDKSLTKTQKENKINAAYAKRTEIFKNITMSLEEQLKLFEGE